jgi:glycosyltransferase involved in cell wall biosynthesis
MRRVLLIAFHFPPLRSSSGLQRPLSLARYLPAHAWTPAVLTATAGAYEAVGRDDVLPPGLEVIRAPALDAARHLSIGGWYPGWLQLPDRWSTWLPGGLLAGWRAIRHTRPDVLWSTYPLATAHLIGYGLHRISGVPWVADFRDPMVEQIDGAWFPGDPRLRRARLFVERIVARHATAVMFCTETARQIYLERHAPTLAARRRPQLAEVIANGFDPEPFAAAGASATPGGRQGPRLVHSGTLYPGPDRDPGALFRALRTLKDQGELPPGLTIVLRATGFDSTYEPIIRALGLDRLVQLAPAIDYGAALAEMLDADGLLLFQGRTSNPAVPAKAYEYLRAGRPILALVDEGGETAALLRAAGVGRRLPIDDDARIAQGLRDFLGGLARGSEPVLSVGAADRYSRIARVAEFATLFTQVTDGNEPDRAR